jgi:hypothetical protein
VYEPVPEAGMGYATRHTGREGAAHSPGPGPGPVGGSLGCNLGPVVHVARRHSHSSAGHGRRRSSRCSTCSDVEVGVKWNVGGRRSSVG